MARCAAEAPELDARHRQALTDVLRGNRQQSSVLRGRVMRPAPRGWRQASSLSIEEAGRVLGVKRSRAYELADTGELPTYRTAAGSRRVRPADLEGRVHGRGG